MVGLTIHYKYLMDFKYLAIKYLYITPPSRKFLCYYIQTQLPAGRKDCEAHLSYVLHMVLNLRFFFNRLVLANVFKSKLESL